MTLDDLPDGSTVFLDANVLVYYFAADVRYGPPCDRMMARIESGNFVAATSSHVIADTAHRLLTLEAIALHGLPAKSIATRLRRHPEIIQSLSVHRRAIDQLAGQVMVIIPIDAQILQAASAVSSQFGLLFGDSLIVAAMAQRGVTNLASNDADFDRVSGITRYSPL
jgi:predicted nucleic acid-binding protein